MLERISGFTKEQAKEYLLSNLTDELMHDKAVKIAEIEAQLKDEADMRARTLISHAIQMCIRDRPWASSRSARAAASPARSLSRRAVSTAASSGAVSYTHLDVYKRQA